MDSIYEIGNIIEQYDDLKIVKEMNEKSSEIQTFERTVKLIKAFENYECLLKIFFLVVH